jgi:hypothetical protein
VCVSVCVCVCLCVPVCVCVCVCVSVCLERMEFKRCGGNSIFELSGSAAYDYGMGNVGEQRRCGSSIFELSGSVALRFACEQSCYRCEVEVFRVCCCISWLSLLVGEGALLIQGLECPGDAGNEEAKESMVAMTLDAELVSGAAGDFDGLESAVWWQQLAREANEEDEVDYEYTTDEEVPLELSVGLEAERAVQETMRLRTGGRAHYGDFVGRRVLGEVAKTWGSAAMPGLATSAAAAVDRVGRSSRRDRRRRQPQQSLRAAASSREEVERPALRGALAASGGGCSECKPAGVASRPAPTTPPQGPKAKSAPHSLPTPPPPLGTAASATPQWPSAPAQTWWSPGWWEARTSSPTDWDSSRRTSASTPFTAKSPIAISDSRS